jgi:hypothetical protein
MEGKPTFTSYLRMLFMHLPAISAETLSGHPRPININMEEIKSQAHEKQFCSQIGGTT